MRKHTYIQLMQEKSNSDKEIKELQRKLTEAVKKLQDENDAKNSSSKNGQVKLEQWVVTFICVCVCVCVCVCTWILAARMAKLN